MAESGDEYRPKVLVVDDQQDSLDLQKSVLEAGGMDCVFARSGAEALDLIHRTPVDLVLLDVVLTDINGTEVCRRIKSDPKLSETPVMFVTGRVTPDELEELYQAGGDEFVLKPFSLEEYLVRVKTLLRAGHERSRLAHEARTAVGKAVTEAILGQQRLETVVNAIGAAIAVVGRDGHLEWVNEAFIEWFGDPGEKTYREVTCRQVHSDTECAFLKALRDLRPHSCTWRRHFPDGSSKTFLSTIAPMAEEEGKTGRLLMLIQDVTPHQIKADQLSLLQELNTAVQRELDLRRVLHLILTCVTTGLAIGFNRAFLFLRNWEDGTLEGNMGVGPTSQEDALGTWAMLGQRTDSLAGFLRNTDDEFGDEDSLLTSLISDLIYPMSDERELVVRVAKRGELEIVRNAWEDAGITEEFRARFGATEVIAVPLMSRGKVVGVVLADNVFNGRPIGEEQVSLLSMFAPTAAMAVENAKAFAQLTESMEMLRRTRMQVTHQARLAAIGKTASHVAHEIRNPLVTIGGFARSIHRKPRTVGRVRDNAWRIVEEVQRLENLLSRVMDFSRPARPEKAPTDLNTVIRRGIEQLADKMAENSISTTFDLQESLPEVVVDAGQIHQVVLNLAANAVESMSKPGGKLTVRSWADDEAVHFSISDTGPGMPQEILERMFDPFFTTRKNGRGLGLSVCRGIIADHRGEIRAESEPGRGTTFFVALSQDADESLEGEER